MSKYSGFWREYSGALSMINHVIKSIKNGCSCVIGIDFCWVKSFVEVFSERSNLNISILSEDEIGEIEILSRLCSDSLHKYRPTLCSLGGFVCENFVADSKFNSVIFDCELNDEQQNFLLSFAVDLVANPSKKCKIGCLIFTLGNTDFNDPKFRRKNLRCFKMSDFVSETEFRFYIEQLLLSQKHETDYVAYSATIISLVAGYDVAVADKLCKLSCRQLHDGDWIADYNTVNHSQLNLKIAKISYFIPIIEKCRYTLIDRYFDEITKILPFDDEYGTTIASPYEAEIRHLVFFFRNKDVVVKSQDLILSERVLKIRNTLMHSNLMNFDEVTFLIKLKP